MKSWEQLKYTNTFRELVDKFNINSNNSVFLDSMLGKVLSNGVIYNGNETVEGKIIIPLTPVDIKGNVVNSNTIFDNFTLYFRDTNKLVELNNFPVDLLKYNNGKPQFIYIKEDLTYRVSDYMFGYADEVLLARFIINSNSTWNQFYVIAQRAGTPMYNAADEFYEVEGLYVKSPNGLKLSQTSGTVKRSGIDFTDKVSPDIAKFYGLSSEEVPIRYITKYNTIDYTKNPTNTVITDKYMEYNGQTKEIEDIKEKIRNTRNSYYLIDDVVDFIADELHESIVVGASQVELHQITTKYLDYLSVILKNLDTVLYTSSTSSIKSTIQTNLTALEKWKTDFVGKYIDTVNVSTITEKQVSIIRDSYKLVLYSGSNSTLDYLLANLETKLNSITDVAGTIKTVASGKFTVQRILWDVYEQVLICQYGNKVYDNLDDAIEGTDLLDFPAPYGKVMYIPLAALVIKSGVTSINKDSDSFILDRRWINVDELQDGNADYVARAKSDKALDQITKIINGDIPVAKATTLAHTVDGNTVYDNGDYYLNYENLKNRITVEDNLTNSGVDLKKALSAHQGYILNQSKVDRAGDTLTGTLNTRIILPTTNDTYNLGSSSYKWSNVYSTNANISGTATLGTANVAGTVKADTVTSTTSNAGTLKVTGNTTLATTTVTTLTATNITATGKIITKDAKVTGVLRYNSDTTNPYIYCEGASVKAIKAQSGTPSDIADGTLVFCW